MMLRLSLALTAIIGLAASGYLAVQTPENALLALLCAAGAGYVLGVVIHGTGGIQ